MLSSTASIALLALSTLSLALPQPQSAQTAQAINPINGLPLPGASSAASQSAPTLTANSQSRPTSSSEDSDSESDSDSDSTDTTIDAANIATITASASLSSATDSSSSSDSESPNTDPLVLIWTDTAENTIYTVTRSTTSSIPDPTIQVPPASDEVATATVMGPDGKPTTTSDVTTFVQGVAAYEGAGERLEIGGDATVWWVVMGVAAGFGAMVL